MRRAGAAAALVLLVAACDPIWRVGVKVRDPAARPVDGAMVVMGCPAGLLDGSTDLVSVTDVRGAADVGGMGFDLPAGCDVFVVKRGFRTYRFPYAVLCPEGRGRCQRVRAIEVVLDPE